MIAHATRRLSKALPGATAATLIGLCLALAPGACTTGAVAIAQCREIESARCEASVPCGVIDDVEECKRFYRDQCLHGIAGDTAPTTAEQDACVSSIEAAGACAEDDPDGLVSDCAPEGAAGAGGHGPEGPERSVCEFLAAPWDYQVCDFLNEPPPEGGASG
jgi:hypothetical protein